MILALLLTVSPLHTPAQKELTEPLTHGLSDGKVGEWATWRIDGGGDRVHFWRMALVGEEVDKKGRPACWLEFELGQHPAMKAPLLQLRMLIARGAGMNKDGVTRVFIATGANKPNELADDAVEQLMTDDAPKTPPASQAQLLPGLSTFVGQPTELMTLAGTVTATPIEVRLRSTMVKRIWTSPQVPLVHLAKLEIPGIAHTIEVRDFGINAHSQMVLPAPGTAKIKLEGYDDPTTRQPAAVP